MRGAVEPVESGVDVLGDAAAGGFVFVWGHVACCEYPESPAWLLWGVRQCGVRYPVAGQALFEYGF